MNRRLTIVSLVLLVTGSASLAGEIGYVEDFALAPDRSDALKLLLPGTEDFHYYTALHLQQTGRFDDADALLASWLHHTGETERWREVRHRQALLTYGRTPQQTLAHLVHELSLTFDHQRQVPGQTPDLPTALDPKLIGRERLAEEVPARGSMLKEFESSALEWLAGTDLGPIARGELLDRLNRPDIPNLVDLVEADLRTTNGAGFGRFKIHGKMLPEQLRELLRRQPDQITADPFVKALLRKLQPSADEDVQHDPQAREAYLDRLWAFVSTLPPSMNSLRANVLYHRLHAGRSRGVYDPELFLAYLRLPRSAPYVAPQLLGKHWDTNTYADLDASYRPHGTLLTAIGNDEPLVRDYLMHLLPDAPDDKAYAPYIRDDYLQRVFAEAKILRGSGDLAKWYALLAPEEYRAIQDRVDILFAPTVPRVLGVDEPVKLSVEVKNVPTLLVKVFEVHTPNYCRKTLREVDAGIDLEGLVANSEVVHTYDAPPSRRVRREFEFPQMKGRGVWVVEFIGNGISSRALIRKGRLRSRVRSSVAGHVVTVLDESNRKLPDARVWLGGHEYGPNDRGEIVVPYTTGEDAREQPIVLVHDGFASLDTFRHSPEKYSLTTRMHVERESLLAGHRATVAIRPSLKVNSTEAPMELLEDVSLEIRTKDLDGTASTLVVPGLKLRTDGEATCEFTVPERLKGITFTLRAKVQNLSTNRREEFGSEKTFTVNAIDRTDKTQCLHLAKEPGGWVLDLRGKTGEPLGDRAVNLRLKHRDFRTPVPVSLRSDPTGRITLGPLEDIVRVDATTPEGVEQSWVLPRDAHTYPDAVHGRVGDVIRIPYMGTADAPRREELSLLELRGTTFTADRFDALSIRDGFITVTGLEGGDYDLKIKPDGPDITIRVTDGDEALGYVMSDTRHLKVLDAAPLQIVSVTPEEAGVAIRLANAGPHARVHAMAVRFVPETSAFANLIPYRVASPSEISLDTLESQYVAGRSIGDEYRYILERKYARIFPGNMLDRPTLLLNPWTARSTDTGKQTARSGELLAGGGGDGSGTGFFGTGGGHGGRGPLMGFASVDFLSEPPVVLLNLQPDAQGVVRIGRDTLRGMPYLQVVALDDRHTVFRSLALAPVKYETRDLRLLRSLDPAVPYTEHKRITPLAAGETLTLPHAATARMEVYDSLASVYRLYSTLSADANLDEFRFLIEWPTLDDAKKRERYSKYACHELHFFLYHKDPEFFRTVVRPYLENKKHRTFLDAWLLESDLSGYLRPWAYERLNAAERILLGKRMEAERAAMRRHVGDLYDLIPPDPQRADTLFAAAMQGSALTDKGVAPRPPAAERRSGRGLALYGDMDEDRATAARTPEAEQPAPSPPPADDAEDLAEGDVARDDTRLSDLQERARVRQLYRALDPTREWAENHYYHRPLDQQTADLVTVNGFWNDYASHTGEGPFLSPRLAEAAGSFTEMILALSVLDLPFAPAEHARDAKDGALTLAAASPAVVFHQEILPTAPADHAPVLVRQDYYRSGERYENEGNTQTDKFITEEFLTGVVYGCQVVVTNTGSTRQSVEVLMQIPRGSVPVSGDGVTRLGPSLRERFGNRAIPLLSTAKQTRSVRLALEPYRTETFEHFFYFPAPGEFPHYPATVASAERVLASAAPATLRVVPEPTAVDTTSWAHVSQNGTDEQVLAYLDAHNLHRVELHRIAWRMRDAGMFRKVLARLEARHVFEYTLWSYGLMHNDVPAIREYLRRRPGFLSRCGPYLDSPLVTIDPVELRTYEHLEYDPLVNARSHPLGQRRRIVNDRLHEQYHRLLDILAHKPALDDSDRLAVTYYLLLQDRVSEALEFLDRVDPAKLPTRLQYDYFVAYTDFYRERTDHAREVALRYQGHPVDRWRKRFENVLAQIAEIDGAPAAVVDDESRAQSHTRLAATEPSLDLKVEDRKVTVHYQNLPELTVRYYRMDVELLFSRNPFGKEFAGQFAFVQPTATRTVKLPPDAQAPGPRAVTFDLPAEFRNANVLVEVAGAGSAVARSQAYYANSLAVQVIESYGQLRVSDAQTGKPLPKAYVKVYAQRANGQAVFYKDGYTDLRGRFDYASLSTDEIGQVQRFALLILSEDHGTAVREADPPAR